MTLALHGKSRRRRTWLLFAALLAVFASILSATALRIPGQAHAAGPWYVDPAGNDANTCLAPGAATACATLQQAVTNASAGDTINVASGTYVVTGTINFNKALTVTGAGTPVLQVSGGVDAFNFGTDNVTFQGFKVQKTDKTTQNIAYVHANNLSLNNNEFAGQYVFGDGDVSRAMVVGAGAFTGINITNNVIHDLRQPAYMSGTNTGVISGNYVYRTRGWVVEGGDLAFSGNTWGSGANQNIFDIAILSTVAPASYANIPAMAAANNNAFIEDQRTLPPTLSIVYVSPSGSGSNTGTAISPKQTIQQGIDRAVVGGTVHVLSGNYNEDVLVNKANVKLFGAGIGNSVVSGPIGGVDGATIRVAAAGVLIDGFSITRDGNNPIDWANPSLNSAGVAVIGQGLTFELRNSRLFGNRTAIDVNNSNGNNIHNNVIENNRTGLIFRNQTDSTLLKNNFITNNYTVGIVFLDASSGTNSPLQQALSSTFSENNISGNWYGQVVERQSGGALPLPGSNLKNFVNNWYGTTSPVVTTANSVEPGGSSPFPTMYGGTDTAPGGQPDLAGPASANLTYQPFLCSGVDASPAIGFQPVFGCGDLAIVAPATANVGDTGINVQVVANNATNLYGVQMTVTYDPQLVLTGYTLGPTLGPGFNGPPLLVLNVPGSLTFAFTQQAPGLPASGSGLVLATLTFGAVGAGTANIVVSPGAILSNDQGFQIGPNAVVNDSIVVSGASTTVTGTILLQGRTNHSGATAQIDPLGGPISPATSSVGAFTISGVSVGVHPVLEAVMLGYLKAVKPFTVAAGPNAAGTVTLIGGDANMSGNINILDLSLIAAYFGQSPTYSPALAPNTTPDINGDNVVNILDLSLTAANFGAVGPTSW